MRLDFEASYHGHDELRAFMQTYQDAFGDRPTNPIGSSTWAATCSCCSFTTAFTGVPAELQWSRRLRTAWKYATGWSSERSAWGDRGRAASSK